MEYKLSIFFLYIILLVSSRTTVGLAIGPQNCFQSFFPKNLFFFLINELKKAKWARARKNLAFPTISGVSNWKLSLPVHITATGQYELSSPSPPMISVTSNGEWSYIHLEATNWCILLPHLFWGSINGTREISLYPSMFRQCESVLVWVN